MKQSLQIMQSKCFSLFFILLFTSSYIKAQTNPCLGLVTLSCDIAVNYSLPGTSGAWSPPGPWGTPGSEAVFEYTALATGSYTITVTNNNYYVDLFYKTSSCSSSGWTYLDDIYSTNSSVLNLTAGTTYYFLIDDENTTLSAGTIEVSCPCIPPPGNVDTLVNVDTNVVNIIATTLGQCNDCSLRSSNDVVLEIDISCAGNYTLTTCSGATWDTYLYLTNAACGGTVIAFSDDACGLQSSITTNLNVGKYYLNIEGYSSNSQGVFNLEISTPCTFSPLPVKLVEFIGSNEANYNILEWTTVSEINNDYFIIERSIDGHQFEQIKTVDGNGNNNGFSYETYDDRIGSDSYYYRLKQVDFNGDISNHSTIFIKNINEIQFKLYPNPTSGNVIVDINAASDISIMLRNSLGQLLINNKIIEQNQAEIDLSSYKSGIYFLRIEIDNQLITRKILKN